MSLVTKTMINIRVEPGDNEESKRRGATNSLVVPRRPWP